MLHFDIKIPEHISNYYMSNRIKKQIKQILYNKKMHFDKGHEINIINGKFKNKHELQRQIKK